MPKFFTAARIRSAIDTLTDTRAKMALLDFLIVKRTLAITGQSSVAITQGEPAYIQATKEFAGVWNKARIDVKAEKEIFNIFASQDNKHGFRSGKYISNGTGTTIGGNPWQAILELSQEKPRKVAFRPSYEDHLADLLLKEALRTSKPSIDAVAVWYHRHSDLESLFATSLDPISRGQILQEKFINDCRLTTEEINTLFEQRILLIEESDLTETVAEPNNYLPELQTPAQIALAPNIDTMCPLDLVAALAAKPFVILTGASGTGKSRSTLNLAEQLQTLYSSSTEGQIFQLVSIGPDWTSPKKLLGYRTPFGQERVRADGLKTNDSYEITETLRIILRACHPNATKIPHFLVFDEMNLSHVERYFAPFLSLMEASSILEDGENAPIVDHQSLVVISEILNLEDHELPEARSASLLVANDQALKLPPNLFYVGTVNIDETTYMFSPKVLDRAHVLEVRSRVPSAYVNGSKQEEEIALAHANELLREAIDDREAGAGSESDPSAIIELLSSKHGIDAVILNSTRILTLKILDGCYKLLLPVGFEFGFRVVKEVFAYMHVWTKARLAMGETPSQAMESWVDGLDRALFQKVLPKIHGNRAALGDSLKALSAFLDGGSMQTDPAAKYSIGVDVSIGIEPSDAIELPQGASFRLCQAKLTDMHTRLIGRNYASFVK